MTQTVRDESLPPLGMTSLRHRTAPALANAIFALTAIRIQITPSLGEYPARVDEPSERQRCLDPQVQPRFSSKHLYRCRGCAFEVSRRQPSGADAPQSRSSAPGLVRDDR